MPKEGETTQENTETTLLAGKFETPEALEAGYGELESKLGQQGEEIGSLRKQTQLLSDQLDGYQSKAVENQEPDVVDYNAQIQEITNQIEEGELSVTEGLSKTAQITAEMATYNATQKWEDIQNQNKLNASRQKFVENNPDFFELQRSGALEKIKSQYPGLHDDFSAYHELKVQQHGISEYERGKAEMAKIADGDKNTATVLAGEGSGQQMPEINKDKPVTESEIQDSMMSALKKFRGG